MNGSGPSRCFFSFVLPELETQKSDKRNQGQAENVMWIHLSSIKWALSGYNAIASILPGTPHHSYQFFDCEHIHPILLPNPFPQKNIDRQTNVTICNKSGTMRFNANESEPLDSVAKTGLVLHFAILCSGGHRQSSPVARRFSRLPFFLTGRSERVDLYGQAQKIRSFQKAGF